MATAAFLLSPVDPIPDNSDPNQKMAYRRWREKSADLIHYRSGYRDLKNFKRGGRAGYISNRGKGDEFNFGEYDDELSRLLRLAKAYAGEYLAVWTYGNAVHIYLADTKTALEQKEASFRLTHSSLFARDPKVFEEFASLFEGSDFTPDLKALKAQYESPTISVTQWFKAFGIDGASEMKRADASQLWNDFEQAALLLLRGETVDVREIKKINEIVSQQDEESKMKTRPAKRHGETARQLADTHYDLREVIGEPETPLWQERVRAARFYWDITDCKAGEKMTVGTDKKGLGDSASFGRLLCHYPLELRRDPIFLTLAGLQAEGANGHAFVQSFLSFAEHAHKAGLTLTVYPSQLLKSFRRGFGIESEFEQEPSKTEWAADLFLDLPHVKANVLEELLKWFGKEKAEGLILRAEADGNYQVFSYTDNIQIKDAEKLPSSAAALDAEGLFESLDLPYLLEPGEWREGAYSGADENRSNEVQKEAVNKLLSLPKPKPVGCFKEILSDFPRRIIHKKNWNRAGSDEILALKLTLPSVDDDFQRSLKSDLAGKGLFEHGERVWISGAEIFGYEYGDLTAALLLRVLGNEMPPKTRLAIDIGTKLPYHYELCPEMDDGTTKFISVLYDLDKQEEAAAKQKKGPKKLGDLFEGIPEDSELLTEIVFEGDDDRVYYRVDFTGWDYKNRKTIESIGGCMINAGFMPLGNLMSTEFNNIILRGYAEGHVYGAILITVLDDWYLELVTIFDDGSDITTTTNKLYGDRAMGKRHYQSVDPKLYAGRAEDLVTEMKRRHSSGIERLRASGLQPLAVEGSLEGLAKHIEIHTARF